MAWQAFNCCRVVNAMIVGLENPDIEAISELKWSTCEAVCKLLQSAA